MTKTPAEFQVTARELVKELHQSGYLTDTGDLALRIDGRIWAFPKGLPLGEVETSDMTLIQDSDEHPVFSVLRNSSDAVYAVLSTGDYTLAAAKAGRSVRPFLDDLAQIIGPVLPCWRPGKVSRGLGRRPGILLQDKGGLCVAPDADELFARVMVMEKGCRATIEARILGGRQAIPWIESVIMRIIYRISYSKKSR